MKDQIPVIPDAIITHGGVFHADDVCACAFISLICDECCCEQPQIFRLDTVEEVEAKYRKLESLGAYPIVVDIGGGMFDHHTEQSKRYRRNDLLLNEKERRPYASFGLVVKEFGSALMTEDTLRVFDYQMCVPTDMQDECGSLQHGVTNTLSKAFQCFNPTWEEQQSLNPDAIKPFWDGLFMDAVAVAKRIIQRHIIHAGATARSRAMVADAYEEAKKAQRHWIELPHYVNWQGILNTISNDEIDWCLYPSARGGYQIYSALHLDRDQSLISAELHDEFEKDPECTFVHVNNFTACFKTREAAIKALKRIESMR